MPNEKYAVLPLGRNTVVLVCCGGDESTVALLSPLLRHAASISGLRVFTLLALPEKEKRRSFCVRADALLKAEADKILVLPNIAVGEELTDDDQVADEVSEDQ
jgi:hypothetical protein